jgi:hypothetical protein
MSRKQTTHPLSADKTESKGMNDQTFARRVTTDAEREAQKAFKPLEAGKVMTEHEKTQRAFHANRERLKAERLAREVAGKNDVTV